MSISVRRMTIDDIALGMRLKERAGWNQTNADWHRFLQLQPDGCFVAEWQGRQVATTTTCVFGSVGWIAMVLVDQSFRHRGIGTYLLHHALEFLDDQSVTTVQLDATRMGQPVYERFGFVAEHELGRFETIASSVRELSPVVPIEAKHMPGLTDLDRRATGSMRRSLLKRLLEDHPDGGRIVARGEDVSGYVMLRPGSHAIQIGPAAGMRERECRTLCDWALSRCAGNPVIIDVPFQNSPAVDWARSRGFTVQRKFARMRRGQPADGDIALLWASSGPEKG